MKKQRRHNPASTVVLAAKQLELVRGGDAPPPAGKWYVPELDSDLNDFVDPRY